MRHVGAGHENPAIGATPNRGEAIRRLRKTALPVPAN
jgi:hypothetical protein